MKVIRILWKRINGRTTAIYQLEDGTVRIKEG